MEEVVRSVGRRQEVAWPTSCRMGEVYATSGHAEGVHLTSCPVVCWLRGDSTLDEQRGRCSRGRAGHLVKYEEVGGHVVAVPE